MTEDLTRDVRLRRAAVLLAGAALYAALVYGPLEFFWTPLLVGAVYLAAAAVGGRRGGFWATGLVLAGWGVGVLLISEAKMDLSSGDAYLLGVGAGVTVAGLLVQRGFSVDLLGVGATVFIAGLLHAVAHQGNFLTKPWTYVALLAVTGAVNLALALAGARASAARPAPSS